MIFTQAVSRVVLFCRVNRKIQAFIHTTVCAALAAMLAAHQFASATVVMMETSLGGINIELYDSDAPLTVTNFLKYVNDGYYNDSVIHRSVPGFIFQGGKYAKILGPFGATYLYDFPKNAPVQNEFSVSRSNVRGTIAMAKLPETDGFGNPIPGGGPDSATSEWFFNLADNSANLDYQNGGFTVFGHVLHPGMKTVDAIANLDIQPSSLQVLNQGVKYFGELPVLNGAVVPVNRACINHDRDGACPETEDKAPGGDGNSDGIPDRDQPNVTTMQRLVSGTVTYAADAILTLSGVDAVDTSTALSQLTKFVSPPGMSASFYNGMYRLAITGNMGVNGQQILFFDGATNRPTHYYAYGPTPDNPTPHWYDFSFDGRTGAEIKNDRIILHFADGERGDDDLDPNNDSITHTGAQAVVMEADNGSAQGGGCSIATNPSQTGRGGDWVVVSMLIVMLAVVRRRTHRARHQGARYDADTNIASP